MVAINSAAAQSSLIHQLHRSGEQEKSALAKLSSGKKANAPGDDVASRAAIASLEATVRGLEQADRNITSTSSALNTADGALTQSLSSLQQLRELAVTAASSTLSGDQRNNLSTAANDVISQIDQTAASAEFNGNNLLDGTFQNKTTQVGSEPGQTVEVNISGARAVDLGVNNVDLSTADGATAAITAIDNAITQVSSQLSSIGSTSARFEAAKNVNDVSIENISAAKSQLEDTDFASAMADLRKAQLKKQFGAGVLKEQQKSDQGVVNLLT